ncbi:MBL fold metallo-hydrolase [Schlegelella sp. S2-27]|uniref:MBL fold metallo-hydrolase n=1 Tax=Caldimonas mangrovi TaxID=2944811 RepID=A0ABT0YVP6_9BURK|nr:MBL fold metallo-hydrolase [Caldimonas mangrovi]MCM5682826.1 MBL fold metallo-hydrolase [Caldimonas mangrovi]
MNPEVQAFFDPATWTVSYVVYARDGGSAAIVDPVLDYDPKSGRTRTASADALIAFVRRHELTVEWILETHAHADHLSSARYLKQQLGGRIAIGAQIRTVQGVFKNVFNLEPEFRCDGHHFDHLFFDGERFAIGELQAEAICVPGHTPADMAYRVGNAVFVGDTLFMPDVGTARADFPGGDAHLLYRSIRKLLALPGETRLFVCHDYPPADRTPQWETTVQAQREQNIHVHDGVTEEQFVAMRTARDKTLDMPALILPSIQVNVRAGELPPPEANGVSYLKIPVNAL